MYSILTVCLSNICRSPMAEAVLWAMIDRLNLRRELRVDSAGTHAHRHTGQRPDPRAIRVAVRRGYDSVTKRRARAVTEKDFRSFDCIVAMDSDNLAYLQKICPPDFQHKLHLLLEFAKGLDVLDVPDPYYGNLEGFERVLDLCEAGASGLIEHRLRERVAPPRQTP